MMSIRELCVSVLILGSFSTLRVKSMTVVEVPPELLDPAEAAAEDAEPETPEDARQESATAAPTVDFDVFALSQSWPATGCYVLQKNNPNKCCNLPDELHWTIHGLWPNKLNTMDPQFCAHDHRFNMTVLADMKTELETFWRSYDGTKSSTSFWMYQWNKHGTCAKDVERLSTLEKYFETGLKVFKDHNMNDLFAAAGLKKGAEYQVDTIITALSIGLNGKKPMVSCIYNPAKREAYLYDVRICFDKNLDLVDCTGIIGFPTNCHRRKKLIYPDKVPGK